jgi:hypothetical protein
MSLLEKVVLRDVLSAPTKHRAESSESGDFLGDSPISSFDHLKPDDFEKIPVPEMEDQEEIDEEEEEDYDEFDAEESADSAIDIIDVIQQAIFVPVSFMKLMKRFGGKDRVNELKASYLKKSKGEKLSETEEKEAMQYEVFDEKIREVKAEIPFNEVDIASLKPSTIKYCKRKGIDVNENLAIGAGLVKVLSGRMITIMMI